MDRPSSPSPSSSSFSVASDYDLIDVEGWSSPDSEDIEAMSIELSDASRVGSQHSAFNMLPDPAQVVAPDLATRNKIVADQLSRSDVFDHEPDDANSVAADLTLTLSTIDDGFDIPDPQWTPPRRTMTTASAVSNPNSQFRLAFPDPIYSVPSTTRLHFNSFDSASTPFDSGASSPVTLSSSASNFGDEHNSPPLIPDSASSSGRQLFNLVACGHGVSPHWRESTVHAVVQMLTKCFGEPHMKIYDNPGSSEAFHKVIELDLVARALRIHSAIHCVVESPTIAIVFFTETAPLPPLPELNSPITLLPLLVRVNEDDSPLFGATPSSSPASHFYEHRVEGLSDDRLFKPTPLADLRTKASSCGASIIFSDTGEAIPLTSLPFIQTQETIIKSLIGYLSPNPSTSAPQEITDSKNDAHEPNSAHQLSILDSDSDSKVGSPTWSPFKLGVFLFITTLCLFGLSSTVLSRGTFSAWVANSRRNFSMGYLVTSTTSTSPYRQPTDHPCTLKLKTTETSTLAIDASPPTLRLDGPPTPLLLDSPRSSEGHGEHVDSIRGESANPNNPTFKLEHRSTSVGRYIGTSLSKLILPQAGTASKSGDLDDADLMESLENILVSIAEVRQSFRDVRQMLKERHSRAKRNARLLWERGEHMVLQRNRDLGRDI